jgi:hypothetical protein
MRHKEKRERIVKAVDRWSLDKVRYLFTNYCKRYKKVEEPRETPFAP